MKDTEQPERPSRPADAYFEVVPHLPPTYLLESYPLSGSRLIVTGPDGTPTHWYMERSAASELSRKLRGRCSVVSAPYDDHYRK